MRLLLDTHAFLWWLDGDRRLSLKARRLIGDVAADVVGCVASQGFAQLEITFSTRSVRAASPAITGIPLIGC